MYGSPKTPKMGNWAFQYPRGENVWGNAIPDDTDVLVTHGPPRAYLNLLNIGYDHLLQEIWRFRPRIHVFGHVHAGRGQEWLPYSPSQAAFERGVIERGGIWNLALAFWGFVSSLWTAGIGVGTRLINAAMVGGMRNDERRKPIKVYI